MLLFVRLLLSPFSGFLHHHPILVLAVVTVSPARQEFEQLTNDYLILTNWIYDSILAWHDSRPKRDIVVSPHRSSSLIETVHFHFSLVRAFGTQMCEGLHHWNLIFSIPVGFENCTDSSPTLWDHPRCTNPHRWWVGSTSSSSPWWEFHCWTLPTDQLTSKNKFSKNQSEHHDMMFRQMKFTVLVPIHPLKSIGHEIFISILPFLLDIVWCFQVLSLRMRLARSLDSSFCSSAQVELQGWQRGDNSGWKKNTVRFLVK